MRDAHCCLLVYDVTDKASFDALSKWKALFEEANPEDPDYPINYVFMVIGNAQG
jgi:GTPase SAR1 family protein